MHGLVGIGRHRHQPARARHGKIEELVLQLRPVKRDIPREDPRLPARADLEHGRPLGVERRKGEGPAAGEIGKARRLEAAADIAEELDVLGRIDQHAEARVELVIFAPARHRIEDRGHITHGAGILPARDQRDGIGQPEIGLAIDRQRVGILIRARAKRPPRARIVGEGLGVIAGEGIDRPHLPAALIGEQRKAAGQAGRYPDLVLALNDDPGEAGDRVVEIAPRIPCAELQIGRAEVDHGEVRHPIDIEVAVPVIRHWAGVEHGHRPAGEERPDRHRTARRARIGERIGEAQAARQLEIVRKCGDEEARFDVVGHPPAKVAVAIEAAHFAVFAIAVAGKAGDPAPIVDIAALAGQRSISSEG